MRKAFFTISVAVLIWAAFVVPLPFAILAPSPAQPITEVIRVGGTQDNLSGQLLFTVVEVRTATATTVVDAAIDPHEDVIAQGQVVPPGVDPQQFFRSQRRVFRESLQAAAAVGLRLAGKDVRVSGDGARVMGIVDGAPAADELQVGDVIVAADGQRIQLAAELAAITTREEAGDTIRLVVVRAGERLVVDVEVARIAATEQVGIGVLVETVNQRIRLPVDVTVREDVNIGGPSAGLMMALTVFDLVDPTDLAAGRKIAGTGTVDLAGRVGIVGGIREKVQGAVLAGADVFLVPAALEQEAQAAAPADLEVIGVETVDEAIQALAGER